MLSLPITLNQNQNLLMPTTGSAADHLIKSNNKLNNGKYNMNTPVQKYLMNEDFNKLAAASASSSSSTNSSLLFYNLLNNTNGKLSKDILPATINRNSGNSIEMNMLEIILNEIEVGVENKETAERLRRMISQLHIYFIDRLNDSHISKNKLLAEFEEVKKT